MLMILSYCQMSNGTDIISSSGMSTKDIITMIISAIAILISLYTYWRTNLKPYKLFISPPTILQVNDPNPSLILSISLHNTGSKPALINNIRIITWNNNVPLNIELYVQRELTQFQTSILPLDEKTDIAWFVPFIVKGNDSNVKRLYFAPMLDKKIKYDDILQINRIGIDININGKWFNGIYKLQYEEFKLKFKPGEILDIPENGFTPIFFHGVSETITISNRAIKYSRK